ncbi:MAG: hypothetical protein ABIY52_07265 [Gemmatimonadaceae bacterium]
MTIPLTQQGTRSTTGRSIWSVAAAFIVVFILSLGTDQVLHVMKVYPPWGEPMWSPALNLLALSYRCVFGVLGSYITARLAPHSPMKHVWIGAAIGFVLSAAGAIAGMKMNLGPVWYPVLLALSVVPTSWIGGRAGMRGVRAGV